jgi:hypothetical protein
MRLFPTCVGETARIHSTVSMMAARSNARIAFKFDGLRIKLDLVLHPPTPKKVEQ